MRPRVTCSLSRSPAASPPASRSRLQAQDTIKIGELNSYKAQPAFLDPYKKGWEMAVEEINAKGGVLGKKLEVISRDDGANPGEAVRVAEELVTREGVDDDRRHVPVAHRPRGHRIRRQKKVFFLAAEPLTDKITWQNGNRYTFRLRATTYMQSAMLMPAAARREEEALGAGLSELRVRPVGGGELQGDAEEGAARRRVRHRAGAAARQDRCRRGGAGDRRRQARRDLQRAVRRRPVEVRARGQYPRRVQGPRGREPALRRARISRSAARTRRRSAGSSPAIRGTRSRPTSTRTSSTPTRSKYNEYPRLGSVVGYVDHHTRSPQASRRRSRPTPRS